MELGWDSVVNNLIKKEGGEGRPCKEGRGETLVREKGGREGRGGEGYLDCECSWDRLVVGRG